MPTHPKSFSSAAGRQLTWFINWSKLFAVNHRNLTFVLSPSHTFDILPMWTPCECWVSVVVCYLSGESIELAHDWELMHKPTAFLGHSVCYVVDFEGLLCGIDVRNLSYTWPEVWTSCAWIGPGERQSDDNWVSCDQCQGTADCGLQKFVCSRSQIPLCATEPVPEQNADVSGLCALSRTGTHQMSASGLAAIASRRVNK